MTNLARFKVNTSPSTDRGFDGTHGQALSFQLESPSASINRVTFSVYDSADVNSPLASKNASVLTLSNGAATGKAVDAIGVSGIVTTTLPVTGAHSWIVRCKVNGGVDSNGAVNGNLVFERMVSIRTTEGRRKIVPAEGTQYGPRGWADAQNDDADAAGATGPTGPAGVSAAEWAPLVPVTDFATTAPSSTTLAMLTRQQDHLSPGRPVRVTDAVGVTVFSGDYLEGFDGITGIDAESLGSSGMLYFRAAFSDADFVIEVSRGSSDALSAVLVAHTVSSAALGIRALVADNGSGIGGTIDVVDTPEGDGLVASRLYFRWGYVVSCTDSLLTLNGPVMPTSAGAIKELFWGPVSNLVSFPMPFIPGNFCAGETWSLIESTLHQAALWNGPPGRIVEVTARASAVAVAHAAVSPVVGGVAVLESPFLPLVSTSNIQSTNEIGQTKNALAQGTPIEIYTSAGAAGNLNLSMTLSIVLE